MVLMSSVQEDRPPEPEAIDPKFESILPAPVDLPPPPPPDVVHPYPPIHNGAVPEQPKLKTQNQGKKNMKTKVGQDAAINQTPPVIHARPQAQAATGAANPVVNAQQPVTLGVQLPSQSRPDPGKQAFAPQAPKAGQLQQPQRPQGNTKKPGEPETFHIDDTPIVVPKAAAGASQSFDVRDLTHQAIANGQKIPSGPPPPRKTSPLKPVQHLPPVPQGVNGAPVPELPIQLQKQGRAPNLPKPSGPKGPAVPLVGVNVNAGVEGNHFDTFGGQKEPPLPPPPPPRGPGAGFMGPGSEDSGREKKPQPRDTRQSVAQRTRSSDIPHEDEDVQSNRVSLDSVPTVPFKPTKRHRSVRYEPGQKEQRRRPSHHREYSYADSVSLSSIVTTKGEARKSGRVRRRDLEANAPHHKPDDLSSWSSAESDPREFARRRSVARPKYDRQASRAYYPDDRRYSSQEHPKSHQRARKSSQGVRTMKLREVNDG